MSMRDRPKLSDRLRGKTGEDLMKEIKKEFEDSKRAWFTDRPQRPTFDTFRREGFPFENDNVFGKKSDAGIKSHLEDLAKKHPEFANNLRCPPWGGSLSDHWDKAFSVPVSVDKKSPTCEQANDQSESKESEQAAHSNSKPASDECLKQHGLRNTVDIVEQLKKEAQSNDEPKRSCSAPPDTAPVENQNTMNRPEQKRYTSKIEITPHNPFEENTPSSNANISDNSGSSNANIREIPVHTSNSDMGSPRMGRARTSSGAREIPIHAERTQSPFDSPTMNRKHPQVRHIPIFVEGRSDPVVPRNVEEPVEQQQFQQEQASLKRKMEPNGGNHSSRQQNSDGQTQHKQQPPQENEIPVQFEQSAPASHPPPPPSKPKSMMERIEEIREDVVSLSNQIQQYNGNSRNDKEYLYLDEMLTRDLIKLDLIEVDGNDALRSARKEVIKSIQKSIALLESKVPSTDSANSNQQDQGKADESGNANSNSCDGNSSNQANMDVDNKQAKESANANSTGEAKG